MTEKEVKERLNEILEEWQEILNIKDKVEREMEMSMYFEEMPFKEIQTVLQLLEQKDKRIDDLEKALVEEAIKSTEKIKQLNSGINKLMAKRKKWKNRYYKNKTKVYKLKKKIKEDKEKMQTYYDETKFDYYNKIDELLKILEE